MAPTSYWLTSNYTRIKNNKRLLLKPFGYKVITIFITHSYCFQTWEDSWGHLDTSKHNYSCIMARVGASTWVPVLKSALSTFFQVLDWCCELFFLNCISDCAFVWALVKVFMSTFQAACIHIIWSVNSRCDGQIVTCAHSNKEFKTFWVYMYILQIYSGYGRV